MSLSNKRLFIHIPKTAGFTIRKSPTLRNMILPITPARHISPLYTKELHEVMDANNDHHGNEHARYRDVKQECRDKYKAFAIVRNPWDRVVSRYWFAVKVIRHERKVPESYCDISSFESFLDERFKWGGKKYFWHRAVRGWFPQKDYTTDENNNIAVDVLRFENIREDISDYFRLEKFTDRSRNVTAVANKTKQELYTDKTIQIVADWYKDDIDTFGFDFDTSATKNIWKEQQ